MYWAYTLQVNLRYLHICAMYDERSTRFETLVPLATLHTAQTILSTSLLQHLKSLRKSSSQFETEFDADALLLKILHFSTCKKYRRGY